MFYSINKTTCTCSNSQEFSNEIMETTPRKKVTLRIDESYLVRDCKDGELDYEKCGRNHIEKIRGYVVHPELE